MESNQKSLTLILFMCYSKLVNKFQTAISMASAKGNLSGSNNEWDVFKEIRRSIVQELHKWDKKRKNLKEEEEEFNENKVWEAMMMERVRETQQKREKVHYEERKLENVKKMWTEIMKSKRNEFEVKRRRMEDEEEELKRRVRINKRRSEKVRAYVIRTGAGQVTVPVTNLPEGNKARIVNGVTEGDTTEFKVLGRRWRLPPGHKPRGNLAILSLDREFGEERETASLTQRKRLNREEEQPDRSEIWEELMMNMMSVKMKTEELDKKRRKVKHDEEEVNGNVIWEERTNKMMEELCQKRKRLDEVIIELIETMKVWEEKMKRKEEEFKEKKKCMDEAEERMREMKRDVDMEEEELRLNKFF